MATPVLVQSNTASTLATTGTTSQVITYGATPTQNNLLICCTGSDATVSMSSSGWTLAVSAVNAQGEYMWYKLAGAAESSTVTVTPSSTAPTVSAIMEFSVTGGWNASPLDKTASATRTTSGNIQATGTTATTTTANDFVIGAINPHGFSTAPTSPLWTNSYTNIITVAGTTGASSNLRVALFVATLTLVATGTTSSNVSWTNSSNSAGGLVGTFAIASGTPATATPSTLGLMGVG